MRMTSTENGQAKRVTQKGLYSPIPGTEEPGWARKKPYKATAQQPSQRATNKSLHSPTPAPKEPRRARRKHKNNLANATKATKLRSPPTPPQIRLNLREVGKDLVRIASCYPNPNAEEACSAGSGTSLALPTHVMPSA